MVNVPRGGRFQVMVDGTAQSIKTVRRWISQLLESVTYRIPNNKKVKFYDFYMLSYIKGLMDRQGKEEEATGYDQGEAPKRGPDMFVKSSSLKDDVDYAALTLLPALRDELLDAVLLSVASELRHIQSDSSKIRDWGKGINPKQYALLKSYTRQYAAQAHAADFSYDDREKYEPKLPASSKNYEQAYRAAVVAMQKTGTSDIDFMELAEKAFTDLKWSASYGGPLWAKICRGYILLRQAKINLDRNQNVQELFIYIDHIFDLVHNTGPVLNKTKAYADWLLPALNHKRDVDNIHKLLPFCSSDMRKLSHQALKAAGVKVPDDVKMVSPVKSPVNAPSSGSASASTELMVNTFKDVVGVLNSNGIKAGLAGVANKFNIPFSDDSSKVLVFRIAGDGYFKWKEMNGDQIVKQDSTALTIKSPVNALAQFAADVYSDITKTTPVKLKTPSGPITIKGTINPPEDPTSPKADLSAYEHAKLSDIKIKLESFESELGLSVVVHQPKGQKAKLIVSNPPKSITFTFNFAPSGSLMWSFSSLNGDQKSTDSGFTMDTSSTALSNYVLKFYKEAAEYKSENDKALIKKLLAISDTDSKQQTGHQFKVGDYVYHLDHGFGVVRDSGPGHSLLIKWNSGPESWANPLNLVRTLKDGDKVKISSGEHAGLSGTIIDADETKNVDAMAGANADPVCYQVELDSGKDKGKVSGWILGSEVELVKSGLPDEKSEPTAVKKQQYEVDQQPLIYDILDQVSVALKAKSIKSWVESPGWLSVDILHDTHLLAFGFANGTFGWDLDSGKFGESDLTIQSPVSKLTEYVLKVCAAFNTGKVSADEPVKTEAGSPASVDLKAWPKEIPGMGSFMDLVQVVDYLMTDPGHEAISKFYKALNLDSLENGLGKNNMEEDWSTGIKCKYSDSIIKLIDFVMGKDYHGRFITPVTVSPDDDEDEEAEPGKYDGACHVVNRKAAEKIGGWLESIGVPFTFIDLGPAGTDDSGTDTNAGPDWTHANLTDKQGEVLKADDTVLHDQYGGGKVTGWGPAKEEDKAGYGGSFQFKLGMPIVQVDWDTDEESPPLTVCSIDLEKA